MIKAGSQGHLLLSVNCELLLSLCNIIVANFNYIFYFTKSMGSRGFFFLGRLRLVAESSATPISLRSNSSAVAATVASA